MKGNLYYEIRKSRPKLRKRRSYITLYVMRKIYIRWENFKERQFEGKIEGGNERGSIRDS